MKYTIIKVSFIGQKIKKIEMLGTANIKVRVEEKREKATIKGRIED